MKSFFLMLFITFLIDISVGSADFSVWKLFSPEFHNIIIHFRLPKAITALLAGCALSVSGLLMQALFRNPLADPFVLGINAGGSLGAAAVVLTGIFSSPLLRYLGLVGGAWVGSALSMLLVLAAARRVRDSGSLLVVGVMIGYLVSALVSVMMHFSRAESVQGFVAWSFGSFSGVGWDRLAILSPIIIIAILLSFPLAKPLNAMLLGESSAASLGVNVQRVRFISIALTAVLSGTVTAFCGPVAFIGIAVPHLCRSISKSGDHAKLLPLCIIGGGILAMLADMATQIGAGALPLNAVTSMIGAPFVIHALLSSRKRVN